MQSNETTLEERRRLVEAHRDERRRFAWLRTMIYDEERRHRLLVVLSLLALAAVSVMGFLAYSAPVLPFELATTLTMQSFQYGPFRLLMEAISLPGFAPYNVIITVVVCLGIAWLLGWREGAYLGYITGFQGAINYVLRIVIDRPRPSPELVEVYADIGSTSFPSGHAMFYTVFFGFLFFLAWSRFPRSLWRSLILVLTALLVLFDTPARLYLGAHWLTDLIAGHLIGFVILAVAIEFYLIYLAPSRPAEAEGAIGEHDRDLQHHREPLSS